MKKIFLKRKVEFVNEIKGSKPNYWLNALVFKSKKERDSFLKITNKNGVMTRPIWKLMSELRMFTNCQNDGLKNSIWLQDRVVNIPSSVPESFLIIMTNRNIDKRVKIYLDVAKLHYHTLKTGFLPTLGINFLALMYQCIDEANFLY